MAGNYNTVRDPVHGFVLLNDLEMETISSEPFQRLRYIRQLALTYLVYPGAEHSRFSHSLGVMEFASKIYDTLIYKHKQDLNWDDHRVAKNRQLLRLAALLHDIGHAPFSHASEELLQGVDHETFSRKAMLALPLSKILNKFEAKLGITAQSVADFFSAENIDLDIAFLREIFSGEVDADKMDYLLRDSLFTGVHYGRFDHQRLIDSLCLMRDPREKFGNFIMGIEDGGLHALEGLVLARYFMFTQVYFHRVRRAYDHHLLSFLKRRVRKYPTSLNKYFACDDNYVFSLLRRYADDEDARRILKREPFVEAFSTPEHINDEERTRFKWLMENLQRKYKTMKMFCDTAEKSPHKFEKIGTYVLSRTTGQPALVFNESGIIRSLKNIEQYRVFVSKEDKEKVQKFCKEFWASAAET